jgi:hypothetical protein
LPLYFGLAEADRVDHIEIRWPSGKSQRLDRDIAVNSLVSITEPRD